MVQASYTCKGPRVQGTSERVGCGEDLTAAIVEAPADGEVHVISCPACGDEKTVRKTPSENGE